MPESSGELPRPTDHVETSAGENYVVVARRYRPQTFDELLGQGHIAQALAGAIRHNRVGHAYLFTGPRGVGKTSAARILAKALNCVEGPAAEPCNRCDVCVSVSTGDDVDVLEIDGASNRGIDEIRELRQNVNVRPSRTRYKIYIIDEVHMLTTPAFNALLKTLEEPPEHVKFIFCTTEPEKVPITIRSRCQRFDFAGLRTESIQSRLGQIAEAEGISVEMEALATLARRAAGSMRDSQSLLEQLLAFGGEKITVADVHRMLGTLDDERLGRMAEHLLNRHAAGALAELDAALEEGVDPARLIEQLLGYFRDIMAASVGCPAEALRYASPSQHEALAEAANQMGVETTLATMQILDQALARMRVSTHDRILAELALVRITALADLGAIADLLGRLEAGQPAGAGRQDPVGRPSVPVPRGKIEGAAAAKKKPLTVAEADVGAPADETASDAEGSVLTAVTAPQLWKQVIATLSDIIAENARRYERVAISAPNRLVVSFQAKYTSHKAFCERPEQLAKLEKALLDLTGMPIRLEFSLIGGDLHGPSETASDRPARPPQTSTRQRLAERETHPLVKRAIELFDARAIGLEEPEEA